MRIRNLIPIAFVAAFHASVWAQSGAPNLIQYHGRLIGPMTGLSITTPSQIRIQIIQGGTADENLTTGRVVFTEQAEVIPDDMGHFDYLIGSHTPGVGSGQARLDAEDFNTTRPVFVEIGLMQPDGSAQVMLPRQRLGSVPFAMQAAATALSTDETLLGEGTTELPLGIADAAVTTPHLANSAVTGAKIAPGQVVRSLNGLSDNVTLQAGSNINITPSGNMLTIAAPNALASVSHDATLTGNGTSGMPLGVAVPLNLSGSIIFAIIEGNNTSSGVGVRGDSSSGTGVFGSSGGISGVWGTNVGNGPGVLGHASNGPGVEGSTFGSGPGVMGSSVTFGVEGRSSSGVGVLGFSNGNGGGVEGISLGSGTGVTARSVSGVCVLGISGSGDLFLGTSGGLDRFRVDNDGDVFAKSYTPPSDIRLKTNIQPLTDVLEKLQHLRGISFEWTEQKATLEPREIGVIAQEVESIFPELVKPWGDQGYKGVSYDGLTAVLLEAVKTLKVENEALRRRVDRLEQSSQRRTESSSGGM
ncbi:MAG: tail fiber domain-containing protein [Acidobacteria bacterium]|nr:tail fiber domain-containing protein [Acidobacteriota bacterium]